MYTKSQKILLKKFGYNLKYHRIKRKLSQEKLALLLGINRTYYASVERGERNISLLNIIKIKSILLIPSKKIFPL